MEYWESHHDNRVCIVNPKEDYVAMDNADKGFSYGISSLNVIVISISIGRRFLKGYKTVEMN